MKLNCSPRLSGSAVGRPVAAVATLYCLLLLLLFAGCSSQSMANQPRYEPLEASTFFDDNQSARPVAAVPRHAPVVEDPLLTGMENGEPVATVPAPLSAGLLQRGREQYDIYCAPCHGLAGYGDGMIVQRGFPEPPSLHSERLRQAPAGHYFDAISNGFGVMFAYNARVRPADRWAIIAYIRALQLSQHAPADMLTDEDLEQVNGNE